MKEEIKRAARAQDDAIRNAGLTIWIGAEPTFTRRESQEPQWLTLAEGGDKEEVARRLLLNLARRLGTSVRVSRLPGRQYPGEQRPRFAYGAAFPVNGDGSSPFVDASRLGEEPFEPPVLEPGTSLLTVTPDPGVVEVNSAPAPDLVSFHQQVTRIHEAAWETGLSPVRFRYTGQIADSGGGGQVTLGGPSGAESPFLKFPWLLPGLLRYFNHHPSLSYLFATECAGSASQGPRPDEGVRERFEELSLTLDRLGSRGNSIDPELLFGSLAPLLVDASGNSHRAELNIEKLWNPNFGPRGKMGVVEFRAFRMQESPERLVAVAALLRALTAKLARYPYLAPLIDWGSTLHDRFALPHFLFADLSLVLGELDDAGFGLTSPLREILEARPESIVRVDSGHRTLTMNQALEFWPLLGDVASQECSGARLVDASCTRVEILISHPKDSGPGRVTALGHEIPLHPLNGLGGEREQAIVGLRFRAFVPRPGLHLDLEAQDPLSVTWDVENETTQVEYHQWIPGGGVYSGLPDTPGEAARRRAERVIVKRGTMDRETGGILAPSSGFSVDLRRFAASRCQS